MATPHIAAEPGDFAPAVLMPGDPGRARRIAETLLTRPRLVTDVRGMLGFTGTVDGKRLSVMGSGMGQPSLTIYATELFDQFGVERIIRVGTAGGISERVSVGDVVIATGAHTDSSMNQLRIPGIGFCAVADFHMAEAAYREAVAAGIVERTHIGTIISRDHFYLTPEGQTERLAAYGTLCVEMEAAALYGTAAEYGRRALAGAHRLRPPARPLRRHERGRPADALPGRPAPGDGRGVLLTAARPRPRGLIGWIAHPTREARQAAPTMPAVLSRAAGTIGVRNRSSGRNFSCFFDTPPPTTNKSGLKSISTCE